MSWQKPRILRPRRSATTSGKGWQKRLLALAVSIVIGVLVVVISQETQGEQWAEHLFIAIATAQTAHTLIWEKTGVETTMRKSGVGSKK